jgi:hypothetical protein
MKSMKRKGPVQIDLFASPVLPDPAGPPRREPGPRTVDHRGTQVKVFIPEIRGFHPGGPEVPGSWVASFNDPILGSVWVCGMSPESVLAEACLLIDLDEKIKEELCREA